MKKIFLILVAVCAYVACDPVQEDFSNGGHITVKELIDQSTVVVDKVEKIVDQKTFSATAGTPLVLKENVDVKDCESIVLYFGEAIPDTCWEVSLTGEKFERIPKNVSVYRCEIGEKATNGVLQQIALKHIKNTDNNSLTVKGVYKTYGRRAAPSKEGKCGNVIYCSTSAPVNAKWTIGNKDFIGNYAANKMPVKVDENGNYAKTPYTIILTALCPDSTVLTAEFPVNCEEISNPLVKYYLYGDPNRSDEEKAEDPQLPFQPAAWDAAAMRFSSTEGAHLPTIPDEVYDGLKTLIFDVSDVTPDFDLKVMNGWWSNTYYDHVKWVDGLNELEITKTMARECAKKYANDDPAGGKDLDLMLYSGSMTLKAVYYEE
ncbi:MAG: hypothetical protein IKH32_03770 [Prevotella sp.]|nr:hypothetical protein [Prevotella sp.]MBR3479808.1 hypothetical protein [Prevotella sp.]